MKLRDLKERRPRLRHAIGGRLVLAEGSLVPVWAVVAQAALPCERERGRAKSCEGAGLGPDRCCNACWSRAWARKVLKVSKLDGRGEPVRVSDG